jgi:molecular chaperone GrpE (heat shock protein)
VDDQVAGAPVADVPEVAADDDAAPTSDGAPTSADAVTSPEAASEQPAAPGPTDAAPSDAAPSDAAPAEGPDVHADHDHDHGDEPAAPGTDVPEADAPGTDAPLPHADVPSVAHTLPVPMPPDLPPPGGMPGLAPPRPPGPRDTLPPPPHLAPPSGPDPVVLDRLDDLGRRLDELARLGAHQRELVDELHSDNQRLRAGELFQAQAPLLRDLVRLHDDVERLEAGGGDAAADLALVRQQLLQVLDRAGVRRYEVAAGEPFDGTRHQGVRSVPATDGAVDRTVAAMVRCGFERDDGRVLRPADVEVHRASSA